MRPIAGVSWLRACPSGRAGRCRLPLALGLLCLGICLAPTGAAASGRPLELVTPGEPVAAIVQNVVRVSFDGKRVVYASVGPMPGSLGGNAGAVNQAARGEGGWVTEPTSFPYSTESPGFGAILTAAPRGFSADFSSSIWLGFIPLTPDAPPEEQEALYRLAPNGHLTFLTALLGEPRVDVSDDTQRIVFATSMHLLPADSARTQGESIYEVNGTTLRLVDVDSGGNPLSPCGSAHPDEDGMSRSGDRIFFTSPNPKESCPGPSKVYLAEGGATPVPISESQCTRVDCNAPAPATFAGATPDGSTAFLTTTQQLVDADHDEARDLYAYDVASGELRLVSESAPGETGAAVDGLAKVSDDGSAVYFFALGRLLPGLGLESGENLYLADASGVHFVAPVGKEVPLQISSSGRVAVFATAASLEAGDTDSSKDVYLYEASSGTLTRVSAGPAGGNGSFDADIVSPIKGVFGAAAPVRALSADGRQAFFGTAEQLLPEDHDKALDVYGWADGQLELISPGTGEAPYEFAGSSGDGSTVLFRTTQTLLPADRDGGERDLYAARTGGGFPSAPEAGAGCTGESCLGPAPARAARGGLPSETEKPERIHGKLRLSRIGPSAGEEIVERGYFDLRVRVPGPGLVLARADIPGAGRKAPAALSGDAGAVRAGMVTLRLRATARTRQTLRHGHRLRVRISLRQASSRVADEVVLKWEGGR